MIKNMTQQEIEHELIIIATQLLAETGEPHKKEIKLDDSLQRHLGLDSLGRAELFSRIEKKFSLAMPDRLLIEVDTLNDIINYMSEARPITKKIHSQTVVHMQDAQVQVDPSKAKTLIEVLLLYAKQVPNKPHIYFQHEDGHEEIITYGQLFASSLLIASHLRARGLLPGETVAIMQPTSPLFLYIFFGVLLAGGIPVPIYPPFRSYMLETYAATEARILNNAEVRMLITFDQAEKLSRLLQVFVPSLKLVLTGDTLMQPHELISPFEAAEDSFAFIQYTSGSTNDPKGVLLTHQNLLANIRAYGKAIKVTPQDIVVSWLPLYHDMGLIGSWFGSLYHGSPLILMTPFSFLNHPERWLWAIHYHRATISGAPNFAYELCVRKIEAASLEGLDLSSWRVAANGAEKVYPRTLDQFATKFSRYGFKRSALTPMYGLAESSVALTIPDIEQEFHTDYVDRVQFEVNNQAIPAKREHALAFVSCGKPLEGHEIRIVDDKDTVLPERHVGNLQFRGPSCMQGYYHNPTATQAAYHHGWLDSGDLGYQADGELFITGRRKDLIIKAGRNLYPAEVEELVGNMAGIRQGCVTAFGVTDAERGTEQLIIVAETREKDKAKRESMVQKINEAMVDRLDMPPDRVVLVAPHTIPKTSSGKLQRAACKTMYLEHRLGKWHLPGWLQITKLSLQMVLRKTLEAMETLAKLIYTLYMTIVVTLTLIPIYLVVRYGSSSLAAVAIHQWAKFLVKASFCKIILVGDENLTKLSPLIFIANHASYVDAIVTLSLVPPSTRFVGKKELFSVPIIRTFMKKLHYLEVDRIDSAKGLEDTKQIENVLKEGNSIFIFPEGTFGYASGLRPFRLGAFKIAAEANVAICPIAIDGTRAVLRAQHRLMWPGSVTITVGEPIAPYGVEWQNVTRLRNEARSRIAKYCGEESLNFIAAQVVATRIQKNK